MRIILLIGLFVGLTGLSRANPTDKLVAISQRDSLISKSINFRIGSSVVDPSFDQNALALSQLGAMLTDTVILSRLDSVLIWATSSPDGNAQFNQKLAVARAQAIKRYIEQHYPRIAQSKMIVGGEVTQWQQLEEYIEAGATPYYFQISAILDRRLAPQATQAQLKTIDGGKAWSMIMWKYMPQMRSGATCAIYTSRHFEELVATKPAPEPLQEKVLVEPPQIVTQYILVENEEVVEVEKPLFALKTNLLYDAVTAINLEVEIPIGKRWSIEAEGIFPWWLSNSKQICFQSLSGTIEAKYWFGDRSNRRQLTGWFIGLYTSAGYYDLEWRDKGYQGEFYIPAALSGGYAHQICRNFSMEYALGVGYMQTRYREYRPMDCPLVDCNTEDRHLVRQTSGKYNWFGPTRLRVSLVWMIHTKTRR